MVLGGPVCVVLSGSVCVVLGGPVCVMLGGPVCVVLGGPVCVMLGSQLTVVRVKDAITPSGGVAMLCVCSPLRKQEPRTTAMLPPGPWAMYPIHRDSLIQDTRR